MSTPNWLPWLLLLTSTSLLTSHVSSSPTRMIPKLGVNRGMVHKVRSDHKSLSMASQGFETHYYDQTLDHFNYQRESYATFKHRFVLNSRHWRGANVSAPIFAYLGEESSLDNDINGIGVLSDNAAQFGALLVYIEHRFYGKSVPFLAREKALKNATLRGYFSSAQALADYAEVLLHIKKKLSADKSPIIVFGGSYGGMLAAWFRLKYPHIALGALASSAPILYFDDITPQNGYYSIVTKDFKEASESCYTTIRESWTEIGKLVKKTDGLSILQKKFNPCEPLKSVADLIYYLDSLYSVAAQYDRPPRYPVNVVCDAVDGAPKGSDVLDRIAAGVSAYFRSKTCNDFEKFFPSETEQGWDWQVCTEMAMPIGRGSNDTMFPAAPFNKKEYDEYCMHKYGVVPRYHWVTTNYGGHHIKEVLERFGSNIIFSNGLRDPYSSGGVLEDISDTIVTVHTTKGSHCLDILPKTEDDPEWLVLQRNIELEIINGWLLMYYKDLLETSS